MDGSLGATSNRRLSLTSAILTNPFADAGGIWVGCTSNVKGVVHPENSPTTTTAEKVVQLLVFIDALAAHQRCAGRGRLTDPAR
jgi:hypothetical protein